MDETPLIQQYMQLRSEFMGYLYAITRDAELAEEIYQNAAVVVIEKGDQRETIRNFHAWAKEVVLPEFKGIKVEGSPSPARPMTIRHLLSHTAGFWGNKGITPEKRDLIRNFQRPLAETVELVSEYKLVQQVNQLFPVPDGR